MFSALEGILNSRVERNQRAKDTVQFFLHEIDLNFDEICENRMDQLKLLLNSLGEKYFYRRNALLWKLIHRVMRREDPRTVQGLVDYHLKMRNARDRLPTPSLMVLREAHEVLGRDEMCALEEGAFLDFYLEQLTLFLDDPLLQPFLAHADVHRSEMRANLERELFQTIACLTGSQVKCKNRYKEHGETAKQSLKWKHVERILAFLLPAKLPMFDDNDYLRTELLDFVRLTMPLLERPASAQLLEQLHEFAAQNCAFQPELRLDRNDNNCLVADSPALHRGQDLLQWPCVEEVGRAARVAAEALYLLCIHAYRSTLKDLEALSMKVLLFRRALSPASLASVWMMIAKQKVAIMSVS